MTRPPRPVKRWLLVADSSRARICAVDRKGRITAEIEEYVEPASRARGAEIESDRPGRSFDTFGTGRHAMGESGEVRAGPARRFAHELGQRLTRGRVDGDFTDLVLVAPPRFLGLLRESLDEPTLACVKAEVAKRLVQEDVNAIGAVVAAVMPRPPPGATG